VVIHEKLGEFKIEPRAEKFINIYKFQLAKTKMLIDKAMAQSL
jgi:hypothetical protein